MKRIFMATALAGAFVVPAFAQDAATAVCSEYAAMDNAGKMAILAELQSLNAEMDTNMSSEEIATGLNTECAENPNALIMDAVKEVKKM
jgi:streptomycin 6-kinase